MAKKRPAKNETAMQVRMSTELVERCRQAAELDNRSLSSWARDRLEKAANRELKKS